MSSVLLELRVLPGVRALASVMAVLHARAADVTGMTYDPQSDHAALAISVNGAAADVQRLALQIQRRVDVVDVSVHEPGSRRAGPGDALPPPDAVRPRCTID